MRRRVFIALLVLDSAAATRRLHAPRLLFAVRVTKPRERRLENA